MSTLTITDFLEARIAEDEADARGALGLHWDGSAYQQVRTVSGDDPHYYKVASGQVGLEHWEPRERLDPGATFKHIARHDPARVLAECAAKRAIVAAFDPAAPDLDPYVGKDVIAMLAAVYADHPEYRKEWAL